MTPPAADTPPWPPHRGEVAALLRADPDTAGWSPLLKTTVGLFLEADVQTVLFWGPDYVAYYNDIYAPTIGNKHPRALGRPAVQSWTELWDDLEPLLASVRLTGETVAARDRPFRIERRGYLEEVFFDISYSAVRDDDGTVAGVLCLVRETTDHVLATRERDRSDAALRVAEVALRAEAERLQLALNAGAVIGTWLWDVPNDRFTADASFARTFSRDPQALHDGLPIADVLQAVHPDDRPGVDAQLAEALSRGGRYRAEYRVGRREAGWVWLEANGHVELDATGRAVRFPGVLIDITDRRGAAEARDQFRLAQAAAGLGLFSLNIATDVLTVSPEFCRLFGLPVSPTLPAARVEALHVPTAAGSRMSTAEGRASGDSVLQTEYCIRRADNGEPVWLARRAEYVRDVHGRITDMRGVVQDITREKAAAAALQAHQDELARVNASLEQRVQQRTRDLDRVWRLATDLMLIARLDGTVQAVNPAWHDRLGWQDTELVGVPFIDFVHPEDVPRSIDANRRLADGGTLQQFENRWRHRDGRWRVIAWTAVPEGGFVHAVGRDVTDARAAAEALREAEDRLRQSQKMEAIGQLTGGIAHDFNNLLQGISGSLEVVRKRLAQGRPDEVVRHVTTALGATQRAAALTHRLLAFARRQPLDPKPVRANPLVQSMEDLLRRTLGEHIALELVLHGGLWTTLCDPHQLESALLNLAINARDAMPDGGTLRIETCNATLGADAGAPRDGVRIAVTDTGTGMAPEVRDRAFEPFFTTKPLGQGTGLGLSMVYGFALQSDGICHIDSTPGRGTTVALTLPRHAEPATADPVPAGPAPRPVPQGASVLLVEDDAVVRGLLVDVLGELGCRVTVASDGPAGLAVLDRGEPLDLLLTDIGLPGLNGRQLAEAARRSRPHLRVLLMTGYADSAALAHGALAPGMAMITKPFAIDALVARVREALAAPPAA